MPTIALRVDPGQLAPPASEQAMRRLEQALWAAADALPDLPEAQDPEILSASGEATPR